MKRILIIAITGFILSGCSDKSQQKAEETAAMDSILKIHDNLMGQEGRLMDNKMRLDTLLKNKFIPDVKGSVTESVRNLNKADSAMENWMHNFNPDLSGKSHEEKMTYLQSQKKQIIVIDSQITQAIKESNTYLPAIKTK